MRQSGFPKGRKRYVVDHIVPLECGGADAPSNMQWQTKAEALPAPVLPPESLPAVLRLEAEISCAPDSRGVKP